MLRDRLRRISLPMAAVLIGCFALLTVGVLVTVGQPPARVARSQAPELAPPAHVKQVGPSGHSSHSAMPGHRHRRSSTHTSARGTNEQPPASSVATLVGQVIMSGMSGTWPDAQLVNDVRAGRVGGVIIMPSNVSMSLPNAVRALQAAAQQGGNPPLLISTDQEGGGVKRLIGPPTIATQQIRTVATAREGRLTVTAAAKSRPINVDLAPVADPALVPNSFEAREARRLRVGSPAEVAQLAGGLAQGLMDTGVRPTAKHFPGNGVFTHDTDTVLVRGSSPGETPSLRSCDWSRTGSRS